MTNYSGAHICQCLTRLATVRLNSPVTIAGKRRKTGEQFVEGVLGLAGGLLELGLQNGDVIALCALNRFLSARLFSDETFTHICLRCKMERSQHNPLFQTQEMGDWIP